MVGLTKHSFLFLIERVPDEKICRQCNYQMRRGQICYSRKRQKYLCLRCALRLNYLTEVEVSNFLVNENIMSEPTAMVRNIVQLTV